MQLKEFLPGDIPVKTPGIDIKYLIIGKKYIQMPCKLFSTLRIQSNLVHVDKILMKAKRKQNAPPFLLLTFDFLLLKPLPPSSSSDAPPASCISCFARSHP